MGLQRAYLALIAPDALSSVFKSSLTPAALTDMLRALLGGAAADAVAARRALAFLEGLTRVPRFGMTAMCVGGGERAALSPLVDGLAAALAGDATALAQLAAVRSQFKL